MISFKQFITEQLAEAVVNLEAGIFVKVLPTTDSVLSIKERLAPLPIAEDLHCTAIYSKTVANGVCIPSVSRDKRFDATAVKLEFWEGHDKEGYIVLKLESKGLQKLHSKFRAQGIEPTFKDYSPHVTIVHPVPKPEQLKPIIEELNRQLANSPLKLEFYYGGYTIMEKEDA